MAKIARKNQKIFGASSPTEIGEFGSLAAGSSATSIDPDDIQSLAAYDTGWSDAVVADDAPALEDFNALEYNDTYQLAYLLQSGIPEWDAGQIYYINNICRIDNIIYISKVDDNTNNNPTADTTNWGTGLQAASFTGIHLGTMQRIYSNTLTGDLTALTISGLDGDADLEYELKIKMINSGLASDIYLKPNNTAGSAYGTNIVHTTWLSLTATTAAEGLGGTSGIFLGRSEANDITVCKFTFFASNAGMPSPYVKMCIGQTSAYDGVGTGLLAQWNIGGNYSNNSNITSLVINANFKAGSRIELYARR